jgi:hypothetical protein
VVLCLKPAIQYTVFEQLRRAILRVLSRRSGQQVKSLTALQVRSQGGGGLGGRSLGRLWRFHFNPSFSWRRSPHTTWGHDGESRFITMICYGWEAFGGGVCGG